MWLPRLKLMREARMFCSSEDLIFHKHTIIHVTMSLKVQNAAVKIHISLQR